MNELGAVFPIGPTSGADMPVQITLTETSAQVPSTSETTNSGFGSVLSEAISGLDDKVAEADRMVARFAIDENTPIHHVTVALEEARMAVELATRVRQGVVEGYRELMNMQL